MASLRRLKRPALEIGAQRIAALLVHRRRVQRLANAVAGVTILAISYTIGNASLALLVLIYASAVALGASVAGLRAFGERFRTIEKIAPVLVPEEAADLRRDSRQESRQLVRLFIIAGVLLIPTVVWAAWGPARATVVIPCIALLAYVRSSVKALTPGAPGFAELTDAARAHGCSIVLFRRFAEGPSRLTRNVLVPVLAGYGHLHIVFDQTLGSIEGKGFLGEEAVDLERGATVHRFENAVWRDRVAELIAQADVAVIEATLLEAGVMWECAQCLQHLPPWRVYPVLDVERLGDTPLADHVADFYERIRQVPGVPRDVRMRWFLLGPGGYQAEAVAADVHERLLAIEAIEQQGQDASAFGSGGVAWLSRLAGAGDQR